MTRRIRRRTVLAASTPLLVSACLRRDDGTQPGMSAGELNTGPTMAADDPGGAVHDDPGGAAVNDPGGAAVNDPGGRR